MATLYKFGKLWEIPTRRGPAEDVSASQYASLRWVLEEKGLSRKGRADHRCDDRVGAQATQFCNITRTFGSREDNETIKEGETPEDWKSKPAKNRQKDKDGALDEEA
jgi:hypothetical protein